MSDWLGNWLAGLRVVNRPDEFEVKRLLERVDIAVPPGMRVFPGEPLTVEGVSAPLVVKVCAPDILHKTDLQGVRLNVTSEALAEAVGEMGHRFPEAPVLVESMLVFDGPELIVGGIVDPVFGPSVMVGAGGILTELYRDVTFRLAPFDVAEAKRMLRDLTLHPVFEGFRGMDLGTDTLAGTLAAVSRLVDDLADRLDQLDINPLVYAGGRWTALDAKLVLKRDKHPGT